MIRDRLPWILGAGLAVWMVTAFVGDGGVADWWRLRGEHDRLQSEVFELAHDNDQLRHEISSLRSSRRAVEVLARRDLGLVREGEIVYRFPPPESTP